MSQIINTEEASTPSTPASGKWVLYFKSDGLYILDDTGDEIKILEAEGNQTIVGALTIQSGLNTLTLGADANATTLTDATTKVARMQGPHYTTAQGLMSGFVLESNSTDNIAYFGGGTATSKACTQTRFYSAANATTATGTERMRMNSLGDLLLGTTTSPSANSGKIFVVGDNAADPTMGSNTAGFYGKDVAGTVEAFAVDEAGNAAQLTPHARNAPDWMYDKIPGIETVRMTSNIYTGMIEWTNETRKNTLLQAQIEGESLPAKKQDRTFHYLESFADYNTRTGEELKVYDWDEVQEEMTLQREAQQAAWDASEHKGGPRPNNYKVKEKPDFIK
jgi:hypothetical protein